jgi:hypothetical protein
MVNLSVVSRTWFLRSLAVALTAAAVAKALFPVVPSLGETNWLASPLVHAAIVMLELLAAAWFWLAADRFPRLTRWGGTALFGGFALVSLRSLLNATSCNCFGSLAIPPSVTLTFDLFAVLGLNCLFSSSPLATRHSPLATRSDFGLRAGGWARGGFVYKRAVGAVRTGHRVGRFLAGDFATGGVDWQAVAAGAHG